MPERVDVTIIGGGVNGVALARECAHAGKSVLLVERDDFASGATSRCSRIVQGGLHHLEHGQLGKLHDSLRGREALLRDQSHLVQPLEFVLAAGTNSRYSALEIRAALWLYHRLGKIPRSSDEFSFETLRRSLAPDQRWDLYSFQEAQCEFPERLVADWLLEACAAGAIARNHADVRAIQTSEGRIRGVLVRDTITGEDSYVESEWLINATGPWTDVVRDITGLASHSKLVSSVRESHVMLRRFPGAPTTGLLAHARDGRPISISPWNGMLQVGPTNALQDGNPSQVAPSREEIEFLLGCAAALFPNARLTPADIVFSYAGVRPLAYRQGEDQIQSDLGIMVSRHVLHNHADEGALGMFSIFGGTLSTAALLARKTARTMGLHPPRQLGPQVAYGEASGVKNTLRQWASAVHAATGVSEDTAEAVAQWHGRHAMCIVQAAMRDPMMRRNIVDGQPQIIAQAVEAATYEHAVTLGDILLRRVPMALSQEWSEEHTRQAAARIAPALAWNEHRMREEIEGFDEERSRFLYKPRDLLPTGVAA